MVGRFSLFSFLYFFFFAIYIMYFLNLYTVSLHNAFRLENALSKSKRLPFLFISVLILLCDLCKLWERWDTNQNWLLVQITLNCIVAYLEFWLLNVNRLFIQNFLRLNYGNYFKRFLSAPDCDNIHSRVFFSLSQMDSRSLCFSRRNYVSKVWSKVRLCRWLIIEETLCARKIWSTCRWLTPWWPARCSNDISW